VSNGSTRLLRWILAAAAVSASLLTFVWPFAVSADPGDATFRVLAIGTFIGLLASIGALALLRLRGSP
jgi:hypothetical protein